MLVLRQRELAEARPRSAREPTDVVADLEQRHGERLQRTVQRDERVGRTHRLEFVGRGNERQSRFRRYFCRDARTEFGRSVESRPNRGSALRELIQMRECRLDVTLRMRELRGVS